MKERLSVVRKALGLNQRDLARELGISQSTYSLFENGQRVFQSRYIEILKLKFSVNPEWLESGNGDMFLQSEDEDSIVKMLGELNEENKELVALFIEKLLKSQS